MSSGARSGPNNSTPGLVWKKPIKNPEMINKCHEESGFFHLNTGNILFWYVIPVSYLNYHHMIKIYLSCCAAIFEIVFLVWLNVSNHVMFIWHKLIANKCYSICNVLFVLLNAMYSYKLCFIFFFDEMQVLLHITLERDIQIRALLYPNNRWFRCHI